MRDKKKSRQNQVRTPRTGAGITGEALFLGGSSLALSALGGSVASSGAAGLQNIGSFLPAQGTLEGVGYVMRASQGLAESVGKKRKRRS